MRAMSNFPPHIILPDKVYSLSITQASDGRAFERILWDHFAEGRNVLNPKDTWRTRIGSSYELAEDYPSYKLSIPLEWLLIRFLTHHVRTNSVDIISGPGGEVLKSSNFKDYLGRETDDDEAEQSLRVILGSWIRAFPKEPITMGELFVSTDISYDLLIRGLNYLEHLGHIEKTDPDRYKISPLIFDVKMFQRSPISMDRKSNRYYQEVKIEANEPFCFVIMPFREEEFPQRIYKDVIKPFVEDNFHISCYRVDEDHRPDRIDNKIYSYILRGAFIIAEVTTCNPNVFYELGLAHMLEKDCIILTNKTISAIPFDISRIRAEIYEDDDQLREILRKSISALAFKIG